VTVEEALVALLAAVAGILLFLGLAQALDNRRPRPMRRRYRPLEDSRGCRRDEAPSRDSAGGPPSADDL
jgi:hypothetical protein